MLVFPSNPDPGDLFGQWRWDGEKWTRAAGGPFMLEALGDVSIIDPTMGQTLVWNANGEKWVNVSPPLAGLADVALTAPAAGEFLSYDGTRWTNRPPSLAGLADVAVSAPAWGQVLTYNGGTQRWENASTVAGPFVINGAADSTALTVSAAAGQWGIVIGRSEPGTFIYGGDNSNGQQFVIEDIAGFVRFDARNARMLLAQQGKSCLVINDSGGIQINPYSQISDTALWVTGAGGGLWAEVVETNVGGNGLWLRAGSNGGEYCALFRNQANNVNYFRIMGDGTGELGPAASKMGWDSSGRFFINSSGSPWAKFLVQGVAGEFAVQITGAQNAVALFVTGAPNHTTQQWIAQFIQNTPMGGGVSNGVEVRGGSGSQRQDTSFKVKDGFNANTYLCCYGNGEVDFPTIRSSTGGGAYAYFTNVNAGGAANPSNTLTWLSSSGKLKRDIHSVSRSHAKEIIAKLRTVRYRSKCEGDDPTLTHYGLIAEEVAEVDPNLVTFRDGEPLSVAYDRVAMMLLPIVQEILGVAEKSLC